MMSAGIYLKTAAGRSEIDTRTLKLSPALRMVLLLVDGHRTGEELMRLAADLHAPADVLKTLAGMGLIEVGSDASARANASGSAATANAAPQGTPAERFGLLYGLMSESVNQYLGIRGYFVQLKIERCLDAVELMALLPTHLGCHR